MTPDDGDCVVDVGPFGVVDAVDAAFDSTDQPPDSGDFLVDGGGVGAGPIVDSADGGGQSFPGAQLIVEVRLQLGQVGDVGAEVVAAGAPDSSTSARGIW